jgi:hypothetical protein
MLHKTVVANVDEVSSQQMLHHLYTIVCYVNMKINNLHNHMWHMKKVLIFL